MKKTIAALLSATVLLASCNQYEKTPSGVKYKITKGGNKQTLKQGDFIKFNIEYKMPPKDSVFSSTFNRIPGYMLVDSARIPKHSFQEIVTKLAPGDKVDFVLSVDSLKKLGYLDYDNVFHARDMIKGRAEIIKVLPGKESVEKDMESEMKVEKDREAKDLQTYLTKNNIKAQQTPSGAYVQVDRQGDGAKPDTGNQVKLMYRGSILGGKEFDTNMNPNGMNTQPLVVIIGAKGGNGSVIPGLDEGLRMFGKGGKGKVFIPAFAGYGAQGRAPLIPPYASMVFDVEVVDIATAPAPQPAPAMPRR
ncbi:MAG: FKBP-type peptidyl-prolyl cis-trans isomerase [Chitinophagaceae bacterium]|nr:FKBP-type peptidyl-prolyl cis-trans isomerase [Chitinophagaceae bacterium]